MAVRGTGEPETLSYEVDLNKDSALGLGITVAGYVCEQGELIVFIRLLFGSFGSLPLTRSVMDQL